MTHASGDGLPARLPKAFDGRRGRDIRRNHRCNRRIPIHWPAALAVSEKHKSKCGYRLQHGTEVRYRCPTQQAFVVECSRFRKSALLWALGLFSSERLAPSTTGRQTLSPWHFADCRSATGVASGLRIVRTEAAPSPPGEHPADTTSSIPQDCKPPATNRQPKRMRPYLPEAAKGRRTRNF